MPEPAVVDAAGAAMVDAPSDARPRGPLTVAVAVSGIRCMLTYILVPGLAPLLGATVAVTTPVVLALYGLGIATSARATWRSAASYRWGMATIASALVSLNLMGLLSAVA